MASKKPLERFHPDRLGRELDRARVIEALETLLSGNDKGAVVEALKNMKVCGSRIVSSEGCKSLGDSELDNLKEGIRKLIEELYGEQIPGLVTAIESGLVGASEVAELGGVQPQLDESLRANLEEMRQDFDRDGIANQK